MAGILTPIATERLVKTLIKEVGIPIQVHCHQTSGMATATYVEGVRAGAGAIDCAISSMAGFTAQPPVESLAAIFRETNYSANLNLDALDKISKYFAALTPKRLQKSAPPSTIDPGILIHQIPGGMISNFRSQLDMQGALDKLPDALEEVTRVREDLGYPPLVTPTSQMVGTQAVMNIITGERYKVIPNEIKDYVRGMYGRSPAPIKPKFIKMVLGKEKPINFRPADKIKHMLPTATDGLEPNLVEKEEDIISYCILPDPALKYFKWRKTPVDQRDPIPADLEMEKESISQKIAQKDAPPSQEETPTSVPEGAGDQIINEEDYKGLSTLLSNAAGMHLNELSIRKGDFTLVLSSGDSTSSTDMKDTSTTETTKTEDATPKKSESEAATEQKTSIKPEKKDSSEKAKDKTENETKYPHTVNAPLGGTFYSSSNPSNPPLVKKGDTVKKGDKVCIIEAMKLFNEIVTTEKCKIKEFLVKDGDVVRKDQPLIAYEPV
jgi:oxaloacetate decarboxylase alpha subunit